MSSCLTADDIFFRTCRTPSVRSLCTRLSSGEFVIEFPHMERLACTSTKRVTIAVARLSMQTMQPSATQKENIAITVVKAFSAGLQRQQCQPEEERRFRSNRGIEEHLLAANMVIDKTLLANTMLWIVSLDLSTTFRRIGIHCGSIAVSWCFSSSNLVATNDIW